MDLQNQNGTAVKNETAKAATNHTQNGAAKKDHAAANVKPQPVQSEEGEPQKSSAPELKEDAKAQPENHTAKQELTLDAKLKLVGDLHRRSVQRINLMSRMRQLEAFEIALAQDNDELEENPYRGCKLIIRDDRNREFITSTPGLIRMVAQYIFAECNVKLKEIESTINFPEI